MYSYIKRSERFAKPDIFADPVTPATYEVVDNVPLLSDQGSVIAETPVVVEKPVHEFFEKYCVDDFKLKNLIDAGVPLKEVSLDMLSHEKANILLEKAKEFGYLSTLDIAPATSVDTDKSAEPVKSVETQVENE